MRALLLIRDLDLGGAQRQLVQLALGLAGHGHEVTVASWKPGGRLGSDLAEHGVGQLSLRTRWRGDILLPARQLREYLRTERTEIVYCFMPVENLIGLLAARGTGARLVWGMRTSSQAIRENGLAIRILFMLQELLACFADAMIANSKAGTGASWKRLARTPVHVVRNGVDTDYFRPLADSRESTRRRLGFTDEERVLVSVGRIEEQKGIPELLTAFARLVRESPAIRLLLVGRVTDKYRTRLDSQLRVGQLERHVRILAEEADIRTIYAAADLLVSASRGEGMSNVIAEAMACGLPVVATRVGESESVLGSTGWLVAAGDPAELAAAIQSAMRVDRDAAGTAARARILAEFPMQRSIRETEAILAGVLR
jgi:glycosyltransferase involved in cell wall biosynthesis